MATSFYVAEPGFYNGSWKSRGDELDTSGYRAGAISKLLGQGKIYADSPSSGTSVNVVGATLQLSADWAIPDSTVTRIPFDLVFRDNGGMTTGAPVGVLIVPSAGWYSITTAWRTSSPHSTWWATFIRSQGNIIAEIQVNTTVSAQNVSVLRYLEADEEIDAAIYKAGVTSTNLVVFDRTALSALRVA